MENNPKLTAGQQELLDDLKEFKEKQEIEIKKMIDKYPHVILPRMTGDEYPSFVIIKRQFDKL